MSFLSSVANSYKAAAKQGLKNLQSSVMSTLRGVLSKWGASAPLGSLGDLTFQANSRHVETFTDFKRATKARYASHDVVGQKPVIEYIGPEGEEITFSMLLNVRAGVEPVSTAAKLQKMCDEGEANHLIIGGATIGNNMWVVTDVSESWKAVDNNGRVLVSQVDVTLKEYVPDML